MDGGAKAAAAEVTAAEVVAEEVLERIELIRRLDRDQAPDRQQASLWRLLDELRALVTDAERWVRLEGDERAVAAVTRLAGSVARIEEVSLETAGAR